MIDPLIPPVHPAIAGVLVALPHPGTPFPHDRREAFIDALRAVLDLLYTEADDPREYRR